MNIISTIKPLILNLIKIKYFHVWQYHCERYFGMLQECTLISLEVALHHIMLPSLHLVWRAIKMTYTKSTFSQLESNDTHWQTDQLPTIFWSPVPLPWPRTAKKVGLSNTLSKESLEWVRTQHCPSEVPRNTLICDHDVHIGLVYLFRCLLVSVSCHCNGDISLPPNPQWAVTQLIGGGRLRSGPHILQCQIRYGVQPPSKRGSPWAANIPYGTLKMFGSTRLWHQRCKSSTSPTRASNPRPAPCGNERLTN